MGSTSTGDISKRNVQQIQAYQKLFQQSFCSLEELIRKKLLKLFPIAELRRFVVSTFYLDIATVLSSSIFPPSLLKSGIK
jgi:hypothetical protein